jgi:hypothetical protein
MSLMSNKTIKRDDEVRVEKSMQIKVTSRRWSELDLSDLMQGFRENLSVADIAGCLLRTEEEVRQKAQQLGMKLTPR